MMWTRAPSRTTTRSSHAPSGRAAAASASAARGAREARRSRARSTAAAIRAGSKGLST